MGQQNGKVVDQCGYQTRLHPDAVHQNLSGKKFLQNVRALRIFAEEMLRRSITMQVMMNKSYALTMWQAIERQSCGSMRLSNPTSS